MAKVFINQIVIFFEVVGLPKVLITIVYSVRECIASNEAMPNVTAVINSSGFD